MKRKQKSAKHKKAEEPLRKAHDELEVRVKERTAELTKANEALVKSEERYKKQFEEALDAIFVADAKTGTLIDCNRAATQLVGRKKSELVGKHQRILHPPEESREDFTRTFKQHLKEKEGQVLEAHIVTKKGEIRDVAIKASLFELRGKKVLQGIFRDVTERKKAEESLWKSKEKYKELANSLPQTVFETDKKANLTFVNRKAFEVFGYTQDDFDKGVNVLQMLIPDDRDRAKKNIRRVMGGEKLGGTEYTALKKDGSTFPVIIHSSPIIHENKLVGLRGCLIEITERKKDEEALRISEERYRKLFESSRDGITTANLKSYITECNQAYANMLGYSCEELKKIRYQDITPSKWHELNKKIFQEVMKDGYSDVFEKEYIRKDGTVFPVALHAWRIDDENDNPVGVGSIVRDITERKKYEEELKSYQKKIEALINSSRDLVFLKDKEFRYLIANKAHEKVFNIKVKDIIGKTDFDFMSKEVARECRKTDREALKSKDPIDKEEFIGDKCYHIVKQSVVDAEDKIMGIAAVIRDITERKKMEEALRTNAERLGKFMDSETDGVILFDSQLNYIDINKTAETSFDLRKEEIVGKNITDIVPNIKKTGRYDKYMQVIKTGKPFFIDDLVPHPKFGDIHLAVRAFKVGEGLGTITTDITKRKQYEEALRRANEELKALDKMKSDFVSNVSHELRSPMTSIKGYTDIILMGIAGKINRQQREFLTTVKKNTDRLTRLIDDLLDISRLEARRIKLDLQILNIPDLVQEIVKSYQVEARARKVDLKTDLPKEFPLLRADSDRIEQVLTNLVNNALKFTSPHGKVILGFQEKKKEALFWVTDTGPGIAREDLSTIFEKFQQLGKKKKKGTGLGLAIAKGLVELHKGSIWAESKRGKGSTFYFTLPEEKSSKSG